MPLTSTTSIPSSTGGGEIGVFRGGTWALDFNGNGVWDGAVTDRSFTFGLATDKPVAGDWSGNGITKIGVKRGSTWVLDMDGNGIWNAAADKVSTFGLATDKPVTGTW